MAAKGTLISRLKDAVSHNPYRRRDISYYDKPIGPEPYRRNVNYYDKPIGPEPKKSRLDSVLGQNPARNGRGEPVVTTPIQSTPSPSPVYGPLPLQGPRQAQAPVPPVYGPQPLYGPRQAQGPVQAQGPLRAPVQGTGSKKQSSIDSDNTSLFNDIGHSDKITKNTLGTAGVLGRSATSYFKEHGYKGAIAGTVQSAAVSAVGHAGLAGIQGDDPWEAAKTGAIRGALVGGGYQGFKAATHANAGTIRGNLKQMTSGVADTYRAHTTRGQAQMMNDSSKVSNNLKTILKANKDIRNGNNFFFGGGK